MKNIYSTLFLIILLGIISCTNNDQRIKKLEKRVSQIEEKLQENKQKKSEIDDRFIGAWKLINESGDSSMDGIVNRLEKYRNTEETYVFHLFSGHDLILTVENKNKLVGQNANMVVRYDETNEELILSIPGNSSWRYLKLQ